MKGLELSKRYYLEYGKPMIEQLFLEVSNSIAVGLAGEGSECLGFDDQISRDHDFEPGFCLWITAEDERKFGFKLERAYAKLPQEFMGIKRNPLSPVGGNRHGVITIEEFYTRFLGAPTPPDNVKRWLYTPSSSLLSACNGQVFKDELGVFSRIREALIVGYPADVRRKKIAGHLIFMAQAGQYNYARCIARGEKGAAQLAIFEFVKHTISTIYLLNNRYEPFYKWAYRGLRELDILGDISDALQTLTELDNGATNAQSKIEVIEDISLLIIEQLKKQGLTERTCNNLERHAYSVLNSITDGELRNMHIMEGV